MDQVDPSDFLIAVAHLFFKLMASEGMSLLLVRACSPVN